MSSRSPGCSPTKTTSASGEPSPNTVCVPVSQSGQALQPSAASRSFSSVGCSGISEAAVPSSSPWPSSESWLTRGDYPEGDATIPRRGAVAERLGRGLQSLVHQFESGRRLFPHLRKLSDAAASMATMIEAENLTKYYGEQRAVDDLSFTVQPGVVTGFL